VGVTRIESNRNRHFGLKIESKSIENRNLEIVTSLTNTLYNVHPIHHVSSMTIMKLNNFAAVLSLVPL